MKKKTMILYVCSIAVVLIFAAFAVAFSSFFMSVENDLSSNYIIQNLKGNSNADWVVWKVMEDDLLHVHVVENKHISDVRLNAIFDVIMSAETIDIDDSDDNRKQTNTHYIGWKGALDGISKETKNNIPKNLHFHVTDNDEGDILIELTDFADPDGYAGYAKLISDKQNNQILKSSIIIYDIDNISIDDFKAILRHELGHSFGLIHSSDSNNIMYPTIATEFPYISQCVVDMIENLYDERETGDLHCES